MHRNRYEKHITETLQPALLLIFLLAFSPSYFAQTVTSSPYSRYGVGELHERAFTQQMGMGGLGYAITSDSTSPFFINITNPASYTGLRLTTFDAAVRSNTYRLQSSSESKIFNNTSLGYLALGFPIGKRGGSSFGLLPYSSIGYNITDTDTNAFGEDVNTRYEGTGGLNQFYIGGAIKLLPARMMSKGYDLSIGANGSYIFGNLNNNRRLTYTASHYFNTQITENTNVGDFTGDAGLQFTTIIRDSVTKVLRDSSGMRIGTIKENVEDWRLIFGLTSLFPSALEATRSSLVQTYEVTSRGVENFLDTISHERDVEGVIDMPMTLGAGITIRKGDRIVIGADYTMQEWSKLKMFGEGSELNNSMKAALGFQLVPGRNLDTKDGYWKRVHYRAGAKYRQTYLELKGSQLTEYSFSFGLGLPLRVSRTGAFYTHSAVNFAVEIGQRGTLDNNLIREQFARALVSFTLNDRWFIKRKFD